MYRQYNSYYFQGTEQRGMSFLEEPKSTFTSLPQTSFQLI